MHTVWTSIVDTIRREVIRDLDGLAGRYTLPPLISYSTWSVLLPQKTESTFSHRISRRSLVPSTPVPVPVALLPGDEKLFLFRRLSASFHAVTAGNIL